MKVFLLCLYVGAIIGVSIFSARKTSSLNDFVLGGRSIGPWMSAFAYGTTYFSAVLIIGYAGKIGWSFGLGAVLIALGNGLIGSFLAWKVLARKTREMTERLNVMTMPEFLEARYDSKPLKVVSALIIFIFLVPYSASVFMGLSYLFQEIFHIPFIQTLIGMAALTALYLVAGGYLAINLLDFIQGIIMLIGVSLMVFFVMIHPNVGGITGLIEKIPQLPLPQGGQGWLSLISLVILTSLGSWGLPQMVLKFYAIKDEKSISIATIVSTLFAFIITFAAYFTGSLTHLFFEELPVFNGIATPDLLMPQLFNQVLPEFVAVLILILVLSASMSTLSSLVMVSSSAIVVDLLKGYLAPNMRQHRSVLYMRILCFIFVIMSLYLALKPNVILSLMALSWGTVAGSFLAIYFYGLYWQGVTKVGAWAGLISGFGTSIGLTLILGAKFIPMAGSLAMLVPLAVVPAVSAITRPYGESHLKHVFGERFHSKDKAMCESEKYSIG